MAEVPKPETKAEIPKPADAAPGQVAEQAPAKPSLVAKLKGLFSRKNKKKSNSSGMAIEGLASSDAPTRHASVLYALAILGVIVTALLNVQNVFNLLKNPELFHKEESEQAKALNKLFREQRETGMTREVTLDLGSFHFEISAPPGPTRKGQINMAEVNLVIECETKAVCRFIEANSNKIRDQIFGGVMAIEQKELLSAEGKRRLKDTIRGRMNDWLTSQQQGKVRKIFITKLIVT